MFSFVYKCHLRQIKIDCFYWFRIKTLKATKFDCVVWNRKVTWRRNLLILLCFSSCLRNDNLKCEFRKWKFKMQFRTRISALLRTGPTETFLKFVHASNWSEVWERAIFSTSLNVTAADEECEWKGTMEYFECLTANQSSSLPLLSWFQCDKNDFPNT